MRSRRATEAPAEEPGIRAVGLVACSLQKLERPAPARQLYCSVLFRKSLAYAERTCDRVYVLSGFWGLVELDQEIKPYNHRLGCKLDRVAWGMRVAGKLIERHGREVDYVILAGEDYARPLATELRTFDGRQAGVGRGVAAHRIRQPLAGMTPGRRLRWLNKQLGAETA